MGAAAALVCADIAAFATYPALMVADAVSQGLSKPFVWEQMSCSDLNRELAAELSEVGSAVCQALLQCKSCRR